jgi:hypothetical protein
MNEHQVTAVSIRPATVTEAVEALTTGQAKRFILLAEETVRMSKAERA